MSTERVTVWFLMVDHPVNGKMRVGNAYATRENAAGWRKFVRAAWHGLPVSIASLTMTLTDGVMDERSRRLLDTKFNMDPPVVGGEP